MMDIGKVSGYVAKNRFTLFVYAIVLASMTYFISYVGMTLMIGLLFLIITLLDSGYYKKLEPIYLSYRRIPVDIPVGLALIIFPFINYAFPILHTTSSFGNVDISSVLVGITILFYGIKRLWDFYLPIGFAVSLALFEILMKTYLMQDILGPAFIQFTIFFATALLNLFGYHVIAGPNYFILPNGQMIYMLVWCSGIESFTLFTLLMTVLLLREKIKWPLKVLLISVGVVGDLFINVIRVAILIAIAIDYGMAIMEVFHSNLGNILFLVYITSFYWIVLKVVVKKGDKDGR